MVKIDKQFLILFSLISFIFLIGSFYYYHKTVQEDSSISWVDFRVYYYAGFRLEIKSNIYDINDGYFIYKYSPIFALVMSIIKFSTSTPAQALCIWYIILFTSFLLSLYLIKEILSYPRAYPNLSFFDIVPLLFIFRYLCLINFTHSYLPSRWPSFIKVYDIVLLYILGPLYLISLFFAHKENHKSNYLAIMMLAILFVLRFLALNIDRAQINILILLLCLFFTFYLVNKKDFVAGLYLGIAIIFKLTPVIFLFYLLIKKRLKAFFSSIITFVVLLFIPSFRFGITRNIELIMNWIKVLRITFGSEYLQHKNQSLMAMISRFFSKNSEVSIAGLEPAYLISLIVLIYVVFMAGLLYSVAKKTRHSENEQILYDLALFFMAMTILSPVGTKTSFIFAIFPISILIKEAFKRRLKDKFINTGLLIYISLIYLNSSDIIGDFSITLHKYSLMTFCLLTIFLLTIYTKYSRFVLSR